MLKIFTTQLQGIFKKIETEEEFSFEDGARLLAQAVVGDGNIYIYGEKEMQAVTAEAIEGIEPLPRAKPLSSSNAAELTIADRALIIARYDTDPKAVELAKTLAENHISFVAISTVNGEGTDPSLMELADVHIDLRLKRGLIPDDDGSRYGYPSSIVALYAYYGISFTLKETLAELD